LAALPIYGSAPEGRQADRHAEQRVSLLRLGLETFAQDVAMDGPAYADSILWRKVTACVAAGRALWHWSGLDLLDGGSDMTKWRADLWRVRPLRLSGVCIS
jgi:hypothetical protein